MILRIDRVYECSTCTGGIFTIDTHPEIVKTVLEDRHNSPKVPGETRIPPGRYPITLRERSPMADRYRKRFGENHLGMIWIRHVPGFKYVYLHIGNEEEDTDGCPLLGNTANYQARRIGGSTAAYKEVYPVVMGALASGEDVFLDVVERLR